MPTISNAYGLSTQQIQNLLVGGRRDLFEARCLGELAAAAAAAPARIAESPAAAAVPRMLGPALAAPGAIDGRVRAKATGSTPHREPPDIPPFVSGSSSWVKAGVAAGIEDLRTETLKRYRGKTLARWTAADRMSGEDKNGRYWRRPGSTEGSHPHYYLPRLKKRKKTR
jgi:hypothetical protein